MDIFFEALAKTDSKEKALDTVKKTILRRKLDIVDDGRSYASAKAEFLELLELIRKKKLLSKMTSKRDGERQP